MAHEVTVNNPYNLALGEDCYNILVKAHFIGHDKVEVKYKDVFAIPMDEAAYHSDELEGAATLAFTHARAAGLAASMMVFCQFFYLDDDTEEWVEIMFEEAN